MYSEIKNIRQIQVILTEILIISANERKIGNISVNITRICLIFCMSEQIFLRIHREYFYNFIYFTYKILQVTRRYLRHKILNLYPQNTCGKRILVIHRYQTCEFD